MSHRDVSGQNNYRALSDHRCRPSENYRFLSSVFSSPDKSIRVRSRPVQSYTHLEDFDGRVIIMLYMCTRCAIYGHRNEPRADDNRTEMSRTEKVGDAQSKRSIDEDIKAAAAAAATSIK